MASKTRARRVKALRAKPSQIKASRKTARKPAPASKTSPAKSLPQKVSHAKSSREKVRAHRKRMRAKGLRLVQMWLPDTRTPEFAAQAHRASLAIANSEESRGSGRMTRNEILGRLKAIKPTLRAHGVAALYLFGSYARDEAGLNSDLDVFVDKMPGRRFGFDELMGAYHILRDALPGIELNYGTREGLSKYIKADVEREAMRIF